MPSRPIDEPSPNPSDAFGWPESSPSLLAEFDAKRWWDDRYVSTMHRLLGRNVCEKLAIFRLPERFVLSVIVPVYNESSSVESVVSRLRETGMPMQIVMVDDGSDDGTSERLTCLRHDPDVVLIRHASNLGKGAAIRTGLASVSGDVVVIQDADEEYDPEDFRVLLQPLLAGDADVVFGTRYGHFTGRASPWWHQSVNALITWLTSLVIGIRLHDVESCYKMARREHFQQLVSDLHESRFGIEIELTVRWARLGLRFAERPIRYRPRWYSEGKKIGPRDGFRALWCIFKYGVLRR